MRKKTLKKKYPNRHRIIEILRENDDLHTMIDYRGNEIVLNLRKHFLYGERYKNPEYQAELERYRNDLIKEGEING
jgi:HEPN domain-containing protein